MKKIYAFLLLLTVVQFTVHAQQSQEKPSKDRVIDLHGEIIDKENGESVPYVHIVNKNTNEGTSSDLSGEFTIKLAQTDTLIFTSVGFEKYTLTLTDKDMDSDNYFVRIILDPSTLELSPVNIFAFKDEAGFKQDILNMEVPENATPEIVIPGAYNGPRRELTGKFSFSSPISAVQNLFSKEVKELKKYHEALQEYPKQKQISEKYNPEVVEKITGLKDQDLNEFMLFCKIPDDYIIKANEYEIILAVNDCYKEFLQTKD